MKPGTLVIVFGLHPGVVIKAPPQEGRVTVMYQIPGGRVRASIALTDLKERKE